MFGVLRRIYRALPLVRELNAIQTVVEGLRERQSLVVRAGQELFLQALLRQERYLDPKGLARHEHQVYSQGGEDGIIREIFRRVGVQDRFFVEVGVGDGLENNTTFLLGQGWRGVWVEGGDDAARAASINFRRDLSDKNLTLIKTFVTAENLAASLAGAGVPEQFDLLSMDIDLNTYWIWPALSHLRPRVVVVEYNATFPPSVDWKAGYDPSGWWDRSFHFGASLKAYELLGRRLGYTLVGCDLSGINAFFVRDDLCGDRFVTPSDAETHYEPARYWLIRTGGHRRGLGDFR